MYYHVLIETKEKEGKSRPNRQYFELDKTNLFEIEQDVVIPYLKKEQFQFDGYFLNHPDIIRVVIKRSERTTKEYSKYENDNMSPGIIMYVSPSDILDYDNHVSDITKGLFERCKEIIKNNLIKTTNQKQTRKTDSKTITAPTSMDKSKVFIVHGHDELAQTETARFIEKLNLKPIILHEQASSGNTIIEKIEENSNVGYGVVLYTPCDVGSKKGDEKDNLQNRARQNVVFKHGYLIAKLGRRNVSALVKDKLEIPNDISGVVYIPMDSHKAWQVGLAKELRHAGYDIDMNLII